MGTRVANRLQSNMPKFYCDYCDTYLTRISRSVRKTHCSGLKHKANVKDYYQKLMEEQAQSLTDKTTAAFQQGKILSAPFSAPPPAGAMILPSPRLPGPGRMPASHMGGPPMMPMMGPPPPRCHDACGTSSWDKTTHRRPLAHDARGLQ